MANLGFFVSADPNGKFHFASLYFLIFFSVENEVPLDSLKIWYSYVFLDVNYELFIRNNLRDKK